MSEYEIIKARHLLEVNIDFRTHTHADLDDLVDQLMSDRGNLLEMIEEDKDNAKNMLRDIKDYKDMLEAKDEIISLHIEQVKKLEAAIYDLQMADTMLEFISRVGEVGLHHEWNAFCDKLARLEKK